MVAVNNIQFQASKGDFADYNAPNTGRDQSSDNRAKECVVNGKKLSEVYGFFSLRTHRPIGI